MMRQWTRTAQALALAAGLATVGLVQAQILDEDFNTVTGTGGGSFLIGPGFEEVPSWDTGIVGENAFAGTTGYAAFGSAAAYGAPTGGVNGTGAGVIDIVGVTYNLVGEEFNNVTGTGGGQFLVGDNTPNTNGYTNGWDLGINGEEAFAGTFGGAFVQTGGGAFAQGLMTGGLNGGGAGQIKVSRVVSGAGNWYGGLLWRIGSFPGAAPLINGGFDDGLNAWTEYGAGWNVLQETGANAGLTPLSGSYVLKMFGQFTGSPNTSGVFQALPAVPGQTWEIACGVQHTFGDALAGQNRVEMGIEFYDSGGAQIGAQFATILTAASPKGQWLAATPLQLVAPAGTASARAVIQFQQPGVGTFDSGAGFVDDVRFRIVSGPNPVDLANFGLFANVRGVLTPGQGENYGAVQLRIEDPQGNRLMFNGVASNNWLALGGLLSTAIEANAEGVPTAGAFDRHAPSYAIVVAFNNEQQTWGTGGTLNVDSVKLTNTSSQGSDWYAGLFWDNLVVSGSLEDLALTADIRGMTPGGNYELRLEGLIVTESGLDEAFNSNTGDCGGEPCLFFSYDEYLAGSRFEFTNNWESAIQGESAFGGVSGDAEIVPGGGFSAKGLTSGGFAGGAAEIRVQDIGYGDGAWYAGLTWPNQGLASADLSQVILSARIRGLSASGGLLGRYELRIEDAQGDRLYFEMMANGQWQTVGGALSTAQEGPALGGGGSGNFDLDSPTYAVTVAFRDETATWQFGGVLQVDDLFLTPVTVEREIGRASFTGQADGQWQSVGGALASADVLTFGDTDNDFAAATGAGGGEFYQANGGGIIGGIGWDTGISGEEAFAGVWGTGAHGTISAGVCPTCGPDGSKAAQLDWSGSQGGSAGGWWVGLAFRNVRLDLSAGAGDNLAALADRIVSANSRGTVDAAGENLGTYQFRIEDPETDFIAFNVTATGGWQAVGGPLSTAVRGQTPNGNGSFNYNLGAYTIVLVTEGNNGFINWGTGGTLTLDDLFVTGINLSDAESFTVTMTFADEPATWGAAGKLLIDNLRLGEAPSGCAGDMNCDGAVNFSDIDLFVEALGFPGGAGWPYPNCPWLNADANGDGDVTFGDIDPFVGRIGASCP